MIGKASWLTTGLLLLATVAEARVTRIEIMHRERFASDQDFGSAGSYEKLIGRFYGELEPAAPLNSGIVDLDKAPRNANGMVEYSSDFYILKPLDLSKGNGALLYDVNNRGNKLALYQFNSAPLVNDPTTAADAGNGFLLRYGFTIMWSGWLPDLPDANNNLRLYVPIARDAGVPSPPSTSENVGVCRFPRKLQSSRRVRPDNSEKGGTNAAQI